MLVPHHFLSDFIRDNMWLFLVRSTCLSMKPGGNHRRKRSPPTQDQAPHMLHVPEKHLKFGSAFQEKRRENIGLRDTDRVFALV